MLRPRLARPVRRALPLLLALTAACRSWQPAVLSADPGLAAVPTAARVRVVRTDGTVLTLTDVTVARDTLFGTPAGAADGGPPAERVAVPVAQVARAEVRRVDGDRTALTVLGVAAGVVAAYVLVVLAALAAWGW